MSKDDARKKCFFCNQTAGKEELRKASTFDLDQRVRKAALKLNRSDLLTKLAAGDMVAIEAEYHVKCLVALYNEVRKCEPARQDDNFESSIHAIAFASLVSYLEDCRDTCDSVGVFKLAYLAKLYSLKLEELGSQTECKINTTRLKNKLLAVFSRSECSHARKRCFDDFQQ
jgi:hypothetical protein